MHVEDPNSVLPQWAVNLLTWFAVTILSLFTLTIGWFTRKYIVKVDNHEKTLGKIPSTYATILSVAAVDKRLDESIPGLATKLELIAYMRQMEENFERRHQETREDRKRMHEENLENNLALRDDVRAVHSRVDQVFAHGP